MTMGIDEDADGWYWSRPHGEGGGHGGYLATGRSAILIDDNDRGFGMGPVRLETTC